MQVSGGMPAPDTSRISPTAHYTAYVWYRYGLSTPELATGKGRTLYHALMPANRILTLAGHADLESVLLARHRVIDHLLKQAIDSGEVGQIVEIAAGLSPRGLRLRRRHPEIPYYECDLAQMAATKRGLIGHKLDDGHRIWPVNALSEDGPDSLAALADSLDANKGVAVITEGLLPYFDEPSSKRIWQNIYAFMQRFSGGVYLSDYYLRGDTNKVLGARTMAKLISVFVQGATHMPFEDETALRAALSAAGFGDTYIHRAGDFAAELQIENARRSAYVRVIEARL